MSAPAAKPRKTARQAAAPRRGIIIEPRLSESEQQILSACPLCACGVFGPQWTGPADYPMAAYGPSRRQAEAAGWRFGGHDTADTLAYCPACLLLDPELPERDQEEIGERQGHADADNFPGPYDDSRDAREMSSTTRAWTTGYRRGWERRRAEEGAAPEPPQADAPVAHTAAHPSRYALDQVYDIPVGDLMPDPHQPRRLFDAEALRTLGDSLRAAGQQHPIRFRERRDPPAGEAPLILVDGERRWRAAQLAGLATLRGILDTEADSGVDLIARQALLNEPGRPLQPWDWVLTFNYLAREAQLTPAQITDHLTRRGIHNGGKPWTRPQVANYLRLLSLPAWCQDLISEGPLTPSHGLRILPHIARPAIMDALRQHLLERVGQGPAPTAPDDEETTICQAEAAAPEPYTVAALRRDILDIYCRIYISMGHGRYIKGSLVQPRWAWREDTDQCQSCPKRAEIDGWNARESFCMDEQCLQQRNAEHAESQRAALTPEDIERETALKQQQVDFAAVLEREKAADNAIREALARAEQPQLLALMLWKLLARERAINGQDKDTLTPAKIAQHLTDHTARRFLRSRVAGLFAHYIGDTERAVIREYLGLEDAA